MRETDPRPPDRARRAIGEDILGTIDCGAGARVWRRLRDAAGEARLALSIPASDAAGARRIAAELQAAPRLDAAWALRAARIEPEPDPAAPLDAEADGAEADAAARRPGAGICAEQARARGLRLLRAPGDYVPAQFLELADPAAALRVAAAAARALAAAHAAGAVHGDLALCDILVSPGGEVRLGGFQAGPGEAPPADPDPAGLAPERIAAGVRADARADLYAFGVALYALLTGAAPFPGLAGEALRHAHLAAAPVPPARARPGLPAQAGRILARLLEKDPARRYGAAAGLAGDLERCAAALAAGETAPGFALDAAAPARAPAAPARAIGRDAEMARARDALDAAQARGGALLVRGGAGMGKTLFARDLLARVVAAGGPAGQGAARAGGGRPAGAVREALESLAASTLRLGAGPARERIAEALDAATGRLRPLAFDLAPGLSELAAQASAGGAQQPDRRADAGEAEAATALARALGAFGAGRAPGAALIDDLHWIDPQGAAALRALAAEGPRGLLLIFTLRDGAPPSPSAQAVLDAFRQAPGGLEEIRLGPLAPAASGEMVAAMLGAPAQAVAPLAAAAHGIGRGVPLGVAQGVLGMVDAGALRRDPAGGGWAWRLEDRAPPGDLDELIAGRLRAAPPPLRDALAALAAARAPCGAGLLAEALGIAPAEAEARLAALGAAGLALCRDEAWAPAHERIAAGALTLVPAAARAALHGRLARAMLAGAQTGRDAALFDVAGQIAAAGPAGEDAPVFTDLAILAAGRALAAGAQAGALDHLDLAESLLGAAPWSDAPRMRRITALRAEILLGLGRGEAAETAIAALQVHADGPVALAEALRLRAARCMQLARHRDATAMALDGLAALGAPLETGAEARPALEARIAAALGGAAPAAAALAAPRAADPATCAESALLEALEATLFHPCAPLPALHAGRLVELTLTRGATAESVYGLAWWGVALAGEGRAEEGMAWVGAALDLADRIGETRRLAAALTAKAQIWVWTRPLAEALAAARAARDAGMTSAGLRWRCYASIHIAGHLLALGAPLPAVRAEIAPLLAVAEEAGYRDVADIVRAQAAFVEAMRGDEAALEALRADADADAPEAGRMPQLALWRRLLLGQALLHVGDGSGARAALAAARPLLNAAPGHFNQAEALLCSALACMMDAGPQDAAAILAEIAPWRAAFAVHAARNPANFGAGATLIEAECARLEGRALAAMRLYEEAAAQAASTPRLEALVHAAAARHAQAAGLPGAAQDALRRAHAAWGRWGATGAQRRAEAAAPGLLAPAPVARAPQEAEQDLLAAMRAAEALSEPEDMAELTRALMRTMLLNAGAAAGTLWLLDAAGAAGGPDFVAAAEARMLDAGALAFAPSAARAPDPALAQALARAARARGPLVFDDARTGPDADAAAPRSTLLLPLLREGRAIAVLHLRNALMPGVFTPRRVALLELLAPQAANALEAARARERLAQENALRRETEAQLARARADLAAAAQLGAVGGVTASIAHEVNQPLAGIVSNAGAALRWLRRDTPDIAEAEAALIDIREGGLRAGEILRTLRGLVRPAEPRLEPVSPDALAAAALALVGPEFAARGVEITAEACAGQAMLQADGMLLTQAILHLLNNAAEAGPAGAPRRAALHVAATPAAVEVAVEDDGPGFAPEALARGTEPFYSTKPGGMGMGLAICRSIAEIHGGTIGLGASGLGGARVVLTLPRYGGQG